MSSTNAIFLAGDDQLVSQYTVTFPEGIPGGGDTDAISIRMDTQFDPPEQVMNTYEVFYRGLKVPKTSMLDETSKEFSVEIRVDQQWKIYDDLNAWFKNCYDFETTTALPEAMTRSTILIDAYDGQNNIVKSFKFTGAKPKSLKVGTWDNQSGDPMRLTLVFIFIDMISE